MNNVKVTPFVIIVFSECFLVFIGKSPALFLNHPVITKWIYVIFFTNILQNQTLFPVNIETKKKVFEENSQSHEDIMSMTSV